MNDRFPTPFAVTSSLAALVLCGGAAFAQNSVPAGKTDVVTLQEFYVSSSSENSYLANETSSGTRLATEIINLPFSVQVLPQEFIRDFQLFDTDLLVPFVGGGAGGDPSTGGGGGTRIRGFITPTFRNGFARSQAPDMSSIERMEVVKGPQSAIYGRTAPGGVINFISKKPKSTYQSEIKQTVGSNDYRRSEGSLTGPITKDLFYRLDTAYYTQHNGTDFWFNRTFNLSGGITYRLAPQTSISVEFEMTRRTMNDAADFTRYLDAAGAIRGSAFDLADRNVAERLISANTSGAYRRVQRNNDSYYLSFEHRTKNGFALRSNAGGSLRRFSRFGPSFAGIWDTRTKTWQSNRTMSNQTIKYQEMGFQSDVTKTWSTTMPQRSLVTFDVAQNNQKNKLWALSGTPLNNELAALGFVTAAERTVWLKPDPFNPQVSGYLPVPAFKPELWTPNASSTENSFQTYYGGLANHTVEAMDKRLILTAAARNDWVKLHQQQPLSPNVRLRDARQGASQFTYSTGINYHLIRRKLVAYASYGTIFQPSPEVDPNTGSILGNRTGRGGEIGFKGVLLDDRLSYSASAYKVQQDNVTTANPANPTGTNPALPALVAGSGTKGEGLSFDFSGSLARDISLLGNIAWGNVYIYKNVASPALVGTPPYGTQSPPSRTGALALRYSPSKGMFRGWKAGLSYQNVSTTQRLARTVNAAGVITAYDLWLPEKNEWAAVLGYRRRLGGQRAFNASLNVNNLFDRRTLWVSGNAPLGREFRGSVSLNF